MLDGQAQAHRLAWGSVIHAKSQPSSGPINNDKLVFRPNFWFANAASAPRRFRRAQLVSRLNGRSLALVSLLFVQLSWLAPVDAETGPAKVETAPSASFAPPGYRLAWNQEFNQLSLSDDPATSATWLAHFGKWNVRNLGANGDEGIKLADRTVLQSGRTVAQALGSSLKTPEPDGFLHGIGNGTLKLRAYPLPETLRSEFWGFPYAASMISSELSFAQRFGYWEVRLRINRIGKGQHFALWLLPLDGSWPPEIDILEVVGTRPQQYTANTHVASGIAPPMTFYEEPSTSNGFHVFGLLRTPEITRWMIDGQVIRETADLIGEKQLYLIASWEIGSGWPGKPDKSTPWPAELEIDYVRFYAPP